MRLDLILIACIVASSLGLKAQDCSLPNLNNGTYLHVNNLRALYAASGNSFWDGHDGQFRYEKDSRLFGLIRNHGLWMGGLDPAGNLGVSIAAYGRLECKSDYYPGPLNEDGTVSAEVCGNYDRAWSVYRYQIEAHLADFTDNGLIDHPIDAVLGWPGRGNAQFDAIAGFNLPDTPQGLAPFADLNGDGVYQPLAGEYPRVSQTEIIPEQIVWSVFNTRGGGATESNSVTQLSMEVQLLGWALNCEDDELLNNAIFSSYKIINRGLEPLINFRAALWTDFRLGCNSDDFIGSAPELNTYFNYESDNCDDCGYSYNTLGGPGTNPPVQAVTFLNRSMDSFIFSDHSAINPEFIGTDEAEEPFEYYNKMQGLWNDGTPITQGGTGYNPTSTDVTNFVLPGDPNDPDAWSEFTEGIEPRNRMAIGSTEIGDLAPGAVEEIDMSYSYHRWVGFNHLENVIRMKEELATLQQLYDSRFMNSCAQPLMCDDDCVWAGDLNADGIANHEDLLAMVFGIGQTGSPRNGPRNWLPQEGNNWQGSQIFGTNNKHLDANGNGRCDELDIAKTIEHYGLTRPDYIPVFDYQEGEDIDLMSIDHSELDFTNLSPGDSFGALIRLVPTIPDLVALAFVMEYDPAYLKVKVLDLPFLGDLDGLIFFNNEASDHVDYFRFGSTVNYSVFGPLLKNVISVRSDLPNPLLSNETFIRFRNIRAYLSDGTEVILGANKIRLQITSSAMVEEPSWGGEVSIAPNPVVDLLHLQSDDDVVIDGLQILNNEGKVVVVEAVAGNSLEVSGLAEGVYYLRIFSEGDFVVRKFVKTR